MTKIHTIVPRSRKKLLPDASEREVVSTQEIRFRHYNYLNHEDGVERLRYELMIVSIDGKKYGPEFIKTLAKNEGFSDLLDFHRNFWPLKNMDGQILHYTNFRYK